ncbi:porin [Glaciecola sp. MH2013]|uniref:OprO/OprP family phosphate-selective porin n=1 Tax=Glaciecola sp. MH2013 TaxID=2785524 RepID=UPI00189C8023|nr:porin [Glaciecola sp. MH2013]MBF7074504.1 porin [Glaciecola sp. MH2013]
MKAQLACCMALLSVSTIAAAKDYPTVEFDGDIKLDYDYFEPNFLEDGLESEDAIYLRRLRLKLSSKITKDWSAVLKVDTHDGIDIRDAYIKYDAWDWANITIGKQKEPFGLERLMSTKSLPFIERSMVTSAFSPNRSLGVKLSGDEGAFNWQLGYFEDDDAAKGSAITGRLAWGLTKNKNLIHVGASFSQRNLDGLEYRINERLEVNSADSLIEGAFIDATEASLRGIEFIGQYEGFVATAEWQDANYSTLDGHNYDYSGGYYQLSYLFSGNNRKYKEGILAKVKAKNDWELALRLSELSLEKEQSEAQSLSLGVNYYLNKNTRFSANYIRAEYKSEGSNEGAGNALALRVFYRF